MSSLCDSVWDPPTPSTTAAFSTWSHLWRSRTGGKYINWHFSFRICTENILRFKREFKMTATMPKLNESPAAFIVSTLCVPFVFWGKIPWKDGCPYINHGHLSSANVDTMMLKALSLSPLSLFLCVPGSLSVRQVPVDSHTADDSFSYHHKMSC